MEKVKEALRAAREGLKKDDPRARKFDPKNFKRGYASQEAIADYLGIDPQKYKGYESKKKQSLPTPEEMRKLCKLYRCDMGHLFGMYSARTQAAANVAHLTGLSDEASEKLSNPDYRTIKKFTDALLCSDQLVSLVSEYDSCKMIDAQSRAFKRVPQHQELASAYGKYRLYPSNASRVLFIHEMCDVLGIPKERICDKTLQHEQEENDALDIAQTLLVYKATLIEAIKAQNKEAIEDYKQKTKFYSYEYELFIEYEKASRLGRMAALFTQFIDS